MRMLSRPNGIFFATINVVCVNLIALLVYGTSLEAKTAFLRGKYVHPLTRLTYWFLAHHGAVSLALVLTSYVVLACAFLRNTKPYTNALIRGLQAIVIFYVVLSWCSLTLPLIDAYTRL